MPYYEHGPGGRIVMICQVCGTACHADGPKRATVQDRKTGAWKQVECPICVCHDCVQTADDPIRRQLAPHVLGQTIEAGVRKIGKGKEEVRPGPFSIEQAISAMQGALGLRPDVGPRHGLPGSTSCGCGEPARTRCIDCEQPLCRKCSPGHDCLVDP